jgi:hypothetical protein
VATASVVQRAKVAGLRCLVCGAATRIDPAHLVPRSLGGCDQADCVVPLCRTHHRAYDQGGLDLVAHLEPQWRREVAHAVGHLGLVGAQRTTIGRRGRRAMKLTRVHPGDIVRVDDGLPYHAVVLERKCGRLRVRMLGRTQAPRTVNAAWVVDHWRHARAAGRSAPR